jgi:hypothetical protein
MNKFCAKNQNEYEYEYEKIIAMECCGILREDGKNVLFISLPRKIWLLGQVYTLFCVEEASVFIPLLRLSSYMCSIE